MSYNADKSLAPASVLKLVTTATAIEVLGENYRYKTDLAIDANDPLVYWLLDLVIPLWGVKHLERTPPTLSSLMVSMP